MEEVSCQVTRTLLEALDESGVDPAPLLHGLPLTVEQLRQRKNRIGWDDLLLLIDRIDAACADDGGIEHIGALAMRAPSSDFLRKLPGSMLNPRHVYEAWARWIAPQHFTHLRMELSTRPDGRLAIVLQIPAGYRESAAFFRLARGVLGALSTAVDLPPSLVEVDLRPRRAVYTLTLPPSPPLKDRVRRASRALLGTRALVDEVARQQAALRETYEQLFRTRQDFRHVIETIPDLVLIHRSGRIVWANRATSACLGYDRSDALLGKHVIELVHPDDREGVIARTRRPKGVKETSPMDEIRLVRSDGEVVTLEVAPSRELVFEGALSRLVVARDVTERRRMREQLMLTDRMASLGTLAAGVAHEINNPLAYIYLNLEIAAREIHESGAPLAKASAAIAGAIEGAERVRAIVGDMKTFSRAQGDDVGAVDVREVLESTLGLAANELRPRARVVQEYREVPPARANRGRLGQVFLNLLLNAADAIPEGQADRNEIRIRTLTDAAGRVVVEVNDTGRGIPGTNLGRIFDPFFTTKPVGAGTGLGLSICHHIVAGLGGEISVDSAEGRGTTFRVALRPSDEPLEPRAGPGAEGAAAQRPRSSGVVQRAARSRRSRVLVVDDEPGLLRTLDAMIADTYDVVTAPNGRAALDILLRDAAFDVILCDLLMSVMTGVELHAELSRVRPDLVSRMVFMTGGAYTARARSFLVSVPNRCLHKPFGSTEILEALREVTAAPRADGAN